MTITHLLEDFDIATLAPDPSGPQQDEAMEEQRLAVFEQGYSAGWDDAMQAQARDKAHLSEALARNLEDISFGYHEALAQMTETLEPTFRSLIDVVLPDAMARTFGHHIVQQLRDMAAQSLDGPAVLAVPEGSAAAVQPMLDRDFPIAVELVEDAGLGPGCAMIRLGTTERELDCNRVMASIRDAVDAFTFQTAEETRHG